MYYNYLYKFNMIYNKWKLNNYLLPAAKVWLIPFNFEFIFNKIFLAVDDATDGDFDILDIVLDLIHWVRTPTISSDDSLTTAKIKYKYPN